MTNSSKTDLNTTIATSDPPQLAREDANWFKRISSNHLVSMSAAGSVFQTLKNNITIPEKMSRNYSLAHRQQ